MSDSDTRQDLFEAIHALGDAAPAMRVGQLMAVVGEICNDLHGRGLWDADDHELLEAIWKLQNDIENNLRVEEVHPTP